MVDFARYETVVKWCHATLPLTICEYSHFSSVIPIVIIPIGLSLVAVDLFVAKIARFIKWSLTINLPIDDRCRLMLFKT